MLKRLKHHEGGVAMVEFAIVLPVLLIMFVGSFMAEDMISCYRKVTSTTRAMTDLISRNVSPSAGVSTTAVATYMTSSQLVMSPFNTANAATQISLLRVCDATHAYVVWSQSQMGTAYAAWAQQPGYTGPAALTAGTVVPIPANMITSPMVATSPDGSNVCNNTAPSTSTKTQVGTAGGYLFYGQAAYAYTPVIRYGAATTTVMADQIYMSPRLN